MKKLIGLGVVALSVLLVVIAMWALDGDRTPGRLVITNRTAVAIAGGTVGVCGRTYAIKAIKPGRSAALVHPIRGDSHYDIKLRFEDGKVAYREFGYVTPGAPSNLKVDITPGDRTDPVVPQP